ncbi:Os12g0593000, partial [Oryza sativa Japonica Group]
DITEYYIAPRLKAFSDWILKAMAIGNLEDIFPAASREYAPMVEELWKDPAIQATYNRRSELPFLPSAASYFLDKAVDISRTEYELSDMDILYADGITSSDGLASTDFSFPQLALDGRGFDEPDPQDTLLRYQLIRINNKGLHENCKWLQMFDDVRLVIFCVAVSDYDEYYEDANGNVVNKMMETRQLFESIALHPIFEQMDFLLLLTKFDILEQKIGKSPLTSCDWFSDFTPLVSRNLINGTSKSSRGSSTGSTLAQMAGHYIAVKFKSVFQSFTERKLYVSYVNALDQESVRSAIRYGREIIKWEDEKPVFGSSETTYSEEPSSYSH